MPEIVSCRCELTDAKVVRALILGSRASRCHTHMTVISSGTTVRVNAARLGLIATIAATIPARLRMSATVRTITDTKPSRSRVSFCTLDITLPASLRSKKDIDRRCTWSKRSVLRR